MYDAPDIVFLSARIRYLHNRRRAQAWHLVKWWLLSATVLLALFSTGIVWPT